MLWSLISFFYYMARCGMFEPDVALPGARGYWLGSKGIWDWDSTLRNGIRLSEGARVRGTRDKLTDQLCKRRIWSGRSHRFGS